MFDFGIQVSMVTPAEKSFKWTNSGSDKETTGLYKSRCSLKKKSWVWIRQMWIWMDLEHSYIKSYVSDTMELRTEEESAGEAEDSM